MTWRAMSESGLPISTRRTTTAPVRRTIRRVRCPDRVAGSAGDEEVAVNPRIRRPLCGEAEARWICNKGSDGAGSLPAAQEGGAAAAGANCR